MKHFYIVLCLVLISGTYCAQPPTGTPGNSSDWRRGGNFNAPPGLGGASNIFGTFFNSPVYHYTGSNFAMVVNGNTTNQPTTNAASLGNASQFVGIGTQTPYTRLHLAAPGANQSGGWRNFMREGFLIHRSNDLFWFGLKPVPGLTEAHNSTIVWSDDPAGAGPDDMVFEF